MSRASDTADCTAFSDSSEPSVGTRMRWYMVLLLLKCTGPSVAPILR